MRTSVKVSVTAIVLVAATVLALSAAAAPIFAGDSAMAGASAVPDPTILGLLGMALAGFGALRLYLA